MTASSIQRGTTSRAVLRILVRAGADAVRTQRTLESLGLPTESGSESSATVTVSTLAGHPWAAETSGSLGASVSSRPDTVLVDPLEATGWQPGDTLALVEDGALLPPGGLAALSAHAAVAPRVACMAATTNHAAGPERTEASADGRQVHRIRPEEWQRIARAAAERWPRVHEDLERVSSPVLLFPDPEAHRAAIARAWRTRFAEPLRLPGENRLLIARDVAVWREPRRSTAGCLQRAELFDLLVADVDDTPTPATTRRLLARLVRAERPEDHPRAQRLLAEQLVRAGDSRAAIQHAVQCLGAWPRHVDVELTLAQAQVRAGETERVRARLDRLQQERPLDARRKAHMLACLGESWRLDGDSIQAEQCIDAALALDPLQPVALDARGLLWLEAGDFPRALEALRAAVRVDPWFAAAWSDYGRALVMSGDSEKARGALSRALSIAPTDREARQLLCRISPSEIRRN